MADVGTDWHWGGYLVDRGPRGRRACLRGRTTGAAGRLECAQENHQDSFSFFSFFFIYLF